MVVLFGSIWRPLGHKVSSRSSPLSWGGQCVQGDSSFHGGVSVCKPFVFTARSAFLSFTYVARFARFTRFARFCGHGSPVETPLPHAPGVRMTVVELTPSN